MRYPIREWDILVQYGPHTVFLRWAVYCGAFIAAHLPEFSLSNFTANPHQLEGSFDLLSTLKYLFVRLSQVRPV